MYCRPSPAVPPRPRRTSASSVSNTPPRSGLIVIAERSATLRVRGVDASSSARSHAVATSMLNRHVSGASGSAPPIVPCSSLRRPERVGVDRRRAGLDPDAPAAARPARWPRRRRASSGPASPDRGAVGRRVAAVHAAAGQVDHDVGAVELGRPRSQRLAVPGDDASGGRRRPARQHDDIVAIGLKCPREQLPDLSRSARQHETHARCCAVYRAHVTRFPARARRVARPDGGAALLHDPHRGRHRRRAGLAAVARARQRGDLDGRAAADDVEPHRAPGVARGPGRRRHVVAHRRRRSRHRDLTGRAGAGRGRRQPAPARA